MMNSSLASNPHPRYVFLTGRMNPGESSLVLPFNNCEVFPRERTIRLELLEFDLCSDNTHPHFPDWPRVPFPPADQPYRPVISVVRPAPLPATKRRRTNYYVPPTFRTGQWPRAGTLDYPTGKRLKRKKKKKKLDPAAEEEEGMYETVTEEEEEERIDQGETAGAGLDEEEGWLVAQEDDEMEPPRKRFRRAGFTESKVKLTMGFKTSMASMAKPLTYSASVTTFYKLVEQLNKRLVDMEGRVFCNLHEHGPPVFAFVNSEGTPQPAQSRHKLRVRFTLPPRTKVYIDPGAIFKMLGLREAGLKPYPRWGEQARSLSNTSDSEPKDFYGSTEVTPTSYIMAAKGLTDEELSLIESFRLGVYIDLYKVTLSWDTDHTRLSSPALSPLPKASLFALNQMIALGMELLLLNSTAIELQETAEGQLTCPKAEFVKPVPSAASRDLESTFSINLELGSKAAKDLGLAARVSPLLIEGGKPFRVIDNAFLRSADAAFEAQTDGGGLSWTQYVHYLSNALVTDAQDDVSDINAQLDSRKREVLEQGAVPKPTWVTLEPAAKEPTPPPREEENPVRAEEADTAREVLQELAAGPDRTVDAVADATTRDTAEEVQQRRDQDPPPAPVDEQGPPTADEVIAGQVLAERMKTQAAATPAEQEREGMPLTERQEPAPVAPPDARAEAREESPATVEQEQPPGQVTDPAVTTAAADTRRDPSLPPPPRDKEEIESDLNLTTAPRDQEEAEGDPPPLEAATPPPEEDGPGPDEKPATEGTEPPEVNPELRPQSRVASAAQGLDPIEEEEEGETATATTTGEGEEEGIEADDPDWLPFYDKWYKSIGISRELRKEIKKYSKSSATLRDGPGYHWWTYEWMGWDAYVRETLPGNLELQRALISGEPGEQELRMVSEGEPMAQPVDPVPVRIPTPPTVNFAALVSAYESQQPQQSAEGAFGDEDEENLRLNPWETHQISNPVPKPPDTFTPWSSWAIPTCPETVSPKHPLPDVIMLLCPDGIRRDYVGAFGMDSLLAKVRHRKHLVFRNYCIIRNPGRLSQLVFEVVDAGFNRIKNSLAHPLLIRMGFCYSTLAKETEVASYL